MELIEADPVIKVHIKVSVSLGDALEPLIDLDPEEVEHLLEHATLILGNGCVPSIDVGAQDEVDILALIFLDGFLHWKVKIQVDDVAEFHEINLIPDFDVFHDLVLKSINPILQIVLLEIGPLRIWHQMVVLELL